MDSKPAIRNQFFSQGEEPILESAEKDFVHKEGEIWQRGGPLKFISSPKKRGQGRLVKHDGINQHPLKGKENLPSQNIHGGGG